MSAGLVSRRIAYFIWQRAGLEPEDTMGGTDHLDRSKYAEVLQGIIDGKGPTWVLEAVVS
jgi:hypothetical protein